MSNLPLRPDHPADSGHDAIDPYSGSGPQAHDIAPTNFSPGQKVAAPEDYGGRTKMAGDVVPLKIQDTSRYENTGPSSSDIKSQAVKILQAPSTGNVVGIGNAKTIK